MKALGLGLTLATSLGLGSPASPDDGTPPSAEVPVAPLPEPAAEEVPAAPPSMASEPAPPPMVVPPMLEPVPAPAPAQPPVAPGPVLPSHPPPPPRGAGAIIGGSLLTGFGFTIMMAMGVSCAVLCREDRSLRGVFGGVAVFGGLTLGGGVALEVMGFRRFEEAVAFDRQYNLRTAMRPRELYAWSMVGGLFSTSFIGLTAGGITGAIYKRRYSAAYGGGYGASGDGRRRLSWRATPTLSPTGPGLAVAGRF